MDPEACANGPERIREASLVGQGRKAFWQERKLHKGAQAPRGQQGVEGGHDEDGEVGRGQVCPQSLDLAWFQGAPLSTTSPHH